MTDATWLLRWTFDRPCRGVRAVRPRIAFDCFRQREAVRAVWMERAHRRPALVALIGETELARFSDQVYDWFDPRAVEFRGHRLRAPLQPIVPRIRGLGTSVALDHRPLGGPARTVSYRSLVRTLEVGGAPVRWRERDRLDVRLRPGFLPAVASHAHDLLRLEVL